MEWQLMRPEWLWALLPATLLALLLWRAQRRTGSWRSVIAPELLQHLVSGADERTQRSAAPLFLLGWVLAVIAAVGPSWEKIPQPVHQKQDALVILLDLSYSMKSADLAPSRIDRARQKILDLLAQRQEGQTGLIAYAGDAHIVTPLTDDTPTIANLLPALHPDMMPLPGSDPVAAVAQGVALMHSAGVRTGTLLLITDGIRERDRDGIVDTVTAAGMRLSVMGVGTATGAPIPLPRGGFVKDQDGTIVMPGLDSGQLQSMANAAGGRYRAMQVDDSDLATLLRDDPLADVDDTRELQRSADSWDDKGYLFALLTLPFALILFRRGALVCLLPVLLLSTPENAQAQSWADLWLTPDQQGQRALDQGDAERASELFDNRDWAGTAAYADGDYAAASEHFSSSDSADAWYNRGNALARQGKLDEAISAYEESLQREPDRSDASENLELLKDLQQQQQEQQEQQQQQQQSDQNQQQDQQQGQEEQQSADGNQQQSGQSSDSQGQQSQQDQAQQSPADNQDQSSPSTQPQQAQQDTQDGEPQEQQQGQGEQQAAQEPQPTPSEDMAQAPDSADSPQGEAQAAVDNGQAERDQALEQWLRRVPDDPSGLLRQKFRYESEMRQREGAETDNDIYW